MNDRDGSPKRDTLVPEPRRVSGVRPARREGCVLVVGGPVNEAHFVAMSLRRRGHAVVMVDDGRAAQAAAETQKLDAVIAFDALPDVPGRTLLAELRRHRRLGTVLLYDGTAPVRLPGAHEQLRRPAPIVALAYAVESVMPVPVSADGSP